MMYFQNRVDAGDQLAHVLKKYREDYPIIIALPRGGVILGHEVAKALEAPLDVLVTRKLGAPGEPELGIGAIAPYGIRVLNSDLIQWMRIDDDQIEAITRREQQELVRRIRYYRGSRPPLNLKNRTVIVVDDGLATGVSAMAAIEAIENLGAGRVILAVPVSSPEAAQYLLDKVDDFICLFEPDYFSSVSAYYEDFNQVTDEEVIASLGFQPLPT